MFRYGSAKGNTLMATDAMNPWVKNYQIGIIITYPWRLKVKRKLKDFFASAGGK
jgi:hypothetical protein